MGCVGGVRRGVGPSFIAAAVRETQLDRRASRSAKRPPSVEMGARGSFARPKLELLVSSGGGAQEFPSGGSVWRGRLEGAFDPLERWVRASKPIVQETEMARRRYHRNRKVESASSIITCHEKDEYTVSFCIMLHGTVPYKYAVIPGYTTVPYYYTTSQ